MDQLYDDHNEPDWVRPESDWALFKCGVCAVRFLAKTVRATGKPVFHCGTHDATFLHSADVEDSND